MGCTGSFASAAAPAPIAPSTALDGVRPRGAERAQPSERLRGAPFAGGQRAVDAPEALRVERADERRAPQLVRVVVAVAQHVGEIVLVPAERARGERVDRGE